jgi:hypothetical protein
MASGFPAARIAPRFRENSASMTRRLPLRSLRASARKYWRYVALSSSPRKRTMHTTAMVRIGLFIGAPAGA